MRVLWRVWSGLAMPCGSRKRTLGGRRRVPSGLLAVLAFACLPAVASGSSVNKVSAEDAAWTEYLAGLDRFTTGDDREARAQWRHLQQFYPALAQGFGTPVRDLVADLERRLAARTGEPAPTAPPAGFESWPPERRVGWLVGQLDEVAEPQEGSPGGVALWKDWRVQRLIAEGEPAVPALLAAVEHDGRFTRSVHFWRDFVRQRTVLTVREPALTAAQAILGITVFAPASTGDDFTSGGAAAGARAADELRAFYAKWHDVPDEERWMRLLADPATPAARAREAGARLARLGSVEVAGTTVWADASTAPDVEAQRRAVARISHPTIAEAMLGALDRELATDGGGSGTSPRESARDEAIRAWSRLLSELGDRRVTAELARRAESETSSRSHVALVEAGARLGDTDPLDAWARRIAAGEVPLLDADVWGYGPLNQALSLLFDHPTAATIEARTRLADADHPWSAPLRHALLDLPAEGPTTGLHEDAWLAMRLLRAALDDATPSGVEYTIEEGSRLVVRGHWTQTGGLPSLLADPATRRDALASRVCDEAAYRLASWFPGMPLFHPLLLGSDARVAAIRAEVDRRLAFGPSPADGSPPAARADGR